MVVATAVAVGCSGAAPPSGFTRAHKTDGGASGDPADLGTFNDNQPTGPSSAAGVCAPSPSNFDVPGNNCDDDGDGTVDNLPVCDSALPKNGDAPSFAKAIGLCQTASGPADTKWGVLSATYTNGHTRTTAPGDGQHGILPQFGAAVKPREGASLGVLSSGWAREFDGANSTSATFKDGGAIGPVTEGSSAPPGFPKGSASCPSLDPGTRDLINVKLQIKVPANAKGLQFDFDFYSGEWPEYVCSRFNDSFIAYLSGKAFNGGQPENMSFDAKNNPVSVNNGFFDRCTAGTETGCSGGQTSTATCPGGSGELAGTGFDAPGTYCGRQSTGGGATGWLTSTAPVAPGEVITLEFMVWDTGDANLDSSVLIDHFTWVPGDGASAPVEPGTQRPPS